MTLSGLLGVASAEWLSALTMFSRGFQPLLASSAALAGRVSHGIMVDLVLVFWATPERNYNSSKSDRLRGLS